MLGDLNSGPSETRNLAGDPEHAGDVSQLERMMIDRMTKQRDAS